MFRRLFVVSAALVLFTGFAATAHADSFSLNNKTGRPASIFVQSVKFTPYETIEKTARNINTNMAYATPDGYHLKKIVFNIDGQHRSVNLIPEPTEPYHVLAFTLTLDDGGKVILDGHQIVSQK